ncbi:hypothetical protein D3C73_1238310 [compost metagenome]
MADAQQPRDRAVPLGLRQQLAVGRARGVDEYHRHIRRRCARHHIAGVLLVARRVRDDELARGRGEIAVGHVDGDALLTLGFQAVGQQREIDTITRDPLVLGARDGVQLVGEHALAVVEQTADQGGLAVIDGTRRDQAQHASVGAGKKGIVQCVHKSPQTPA